MTEQLTALGVQAVRQKLQSGELTAVALTEAHLARIEHLDPQVKAFLQVTPDKALAQAQAADQAIRRGQSAPLLGVPIAVKDVLSTEGIPTTCGSRILAGYIPPYNATVVERILQAGAVILGKTNTDEFAMGSSTENSGYFTTHNPWDLARVPGGSSGGSAAAVASQMSPLALGTDTGGSVRQPGSFCGVVAVKPSYGRVSRYGLIAFASSLDVVGTFGRTVADAALLLQTIAGYDAKDSTSMNTPVPDYLTSLGREIKGLKIGVPREYFIDGMQPEVETAVRQAIAQLETLGAEIHEISLPHTEYALATYYLIAPAEASANLARYDGVRYGQRQTEPDLWSTYKSTRGQGFGAEVKRRIMIGTYALSAGYYDAYYGKAQKVRTLIKQDFEKAFAQVDVIATPTAPSTAFRIGDRADDPMQMYLQDVFTLPASLAGICGLSMPCGFDQLGLPIGLQLIGPFFQEEVILQTAYAYETATAWYQRRPAL
jgi:aspartyl-tRNA(Asn)/glutamyl-tRNA(Gln) amidotransferase subunit A